MFRPARFYINRSVGVSAQKVLYQPYYHPGVSTGVLVFRTKGFCTSQAITSEPVKAADVEDKERMPTSSLRTSVHPPAIKSTFHLKHSSKPSDWEQTPINYSCVCFSHKCYY